MIPIIGSPPVFEGIKRISFEGHVLAPLQNLAFPELTSHKSFLSAYRKFAWILNCMICFWAATTALVSHLISISSIFQNVTYNNWLHGCLNYSGPLRKLPPADRLRCGCKRTEARRKNAYSGSNVLSIRHIVRRLFLSTLMNSLEGMWYILKNFVTGCQWNLMSSLFGEPVCEGRFCNGQTTIQRKVQ